MTPKPKNTFFAQPKFLVGIKAMEHIPVELDGYGAKKPFVITDKSQSKKLLNHLILSLAESYVTIGVLFDDALPYLNHNEIERLAGLFRWNECDSVIAIGGSSVVDNAKALAISVSNGNIFSHQILNSTKVPLVYIATSLIDGFEVTGSINIDGKRFWSDSLFPDVVCIDNRMVNNLRNIDQIVNAASISLTHCIEGVANPDGNPFADSAAFTAITLISENLPKLIKDKKSKQYSLAVVNGIAVAGTVITNTQPGAAVLSSYFLAKQTGIPQGIIAAHILPFIIGFKLDKNQPIREDLLLALRGIDHFCQTTMENKLIEAHKALVEITRTITNNYSLKINSSQIQDHLLNKAALYAEQENSNEIDHSFCLQILQKAYENSLGGSK